MPENTINGHTRADEIPVQVKPLEYDPYTAPLRPDTPPEHLMDRVAFSEHPPLRLVRCRECGLVYRNPVERLHELEAIYARETPPPEVLRS